MEKTPASPIILVLRPLSLLALVHAYITYSFQADARSDMQIYQWINISHHSTSQARPGHRAAALPQLTPSFQSLLCAFFRLDHWFRGIEISPALQIP